MAKRFYVSTTDSTRDILKRISKSAERERARDLGIFGELYGDEEGSSGYEFGSDDEIVPMWAM